MSDSNISFPQFDAVKALEAMMHDGPGGTVCEPWLTPALRRVRDEIVRLRAENQAAYDFIAENEGDDVAFRMRRTVRSALES